MRSQTPRLAKSNAIGRLPDVHRMRRRAFGQADERPYRRLTADWFRAGAAAVLLWLSARHVGDVTAFEHDLERFFADLPQGARGLFEALSRLGPCVHHRRTFAPVAALLGVPATEPDETPLLNL
jgi:hypothetical protein